MLRLIAACVLCTSLLASARAADPQTPPSRIVFGSCCKQDKPAPIWDAIVAEKPELFLMIGDNISGDSQDMAVQKSKWDTLGAVPGFRKLKQCCPILATWDDHDYGGDDAGAEFPKKKESQQLFLDFFDEPTNSSRRKQEGIYTSYAFGPAERRVQVILLDTRYHRSPLKKSGRKKGDPGFLGPYTRNTDPGATILGDAQWSWFDTELRKPAAVRIIASSIQVLPNQHYWEKWGHFPQERVRFMQAIRDARANGAIIISGDRHSAEISRNDRLVGYPLFEVTSSSLNAPAQPKEEPNRDRVGGLHGEENFGVISIDWSQPDPVITLDVRDVTGQPLESQTIRLSELAPKP
jgi:alkaline phosphatase D